MFSDGFTESQSYTYNSNDDTLASVSNLSMLGNHSFQNTISYTYDILGQLSHVDDREEGMSYDYSYDTAGNILRMVEADDSGNSVTKNLTYGDRIWSDRLTTVKVGSTEETIVYDHPADGYISGNPIHYFNGQHYDFSWKKGRQMASSVKDGTTAAYDYDMSGVRSRKTVGDTEYDFETLSGRVVRQNWGSRKLYFIYDDNSMPYALIYQNGSGEPVLYYYLLNIQGDVLGLMDEQAQIQALYRYDPWGAVTVLKADGTTDTRSNSVGAVNPLRYRGYYYDSETGFYYLQSRYYDPAIGRFINADTYSSTDSKDFLAFNMFSYCENNPVNMSDSDGTIPKWAVHVIIGTAVIAAAAALTIATAGTGTALACFAAGALKGAATGAVYGAASGAISGAVVHRVKTGGWKGARKAAVRSAAKGYMSGALTGFVTGGIASKSCFVAGTFVIASTGAVAIESVKQGDLVWAWNEEGDTTEQKKVVETYEKPTRELIKIYAGGEEIITTPTHPFYSPRKGWTAAVELRAGDILVLVNGQYVIVEKIQHELLESAIPVYNLQVEDDHTYYVSDIGVLVHNSCKQKLIAGSKDSYNIKVSVGGETRHQKMHGHVNYKDKRIASVDRNGKIIRWKVTDKGTIRATKSL